MSCAYTLRNLRGVEDVAPALGVDGAQEIRFPRRDLGAEETGLTLMGVKPGRRQIVAHRHDRAEEVYVVLAGSGRIKLDDEILDVRPMDAIRISPGVTRALEGGPEGLEYLAFGVHHDGDGETLEIEQFWPRGPAPRGR